MRFMTKKQRSQLDKITNLKEKFLYSELCKDRLHTNYLIKNYGHRFGKYIHDINSKFGWCVEKERAADKKNYIYWIGI